jgi:hypothetical protein
MTQALYAHMNNKKRIIIKKLALFTTAKRQKQPKYL